MWYCEEMQKDLELLQKLIKEVKQEYEEKGEEYSEGEVITEAIGRYLDFSSYEIKQVQQFLKGFGAILSNSGVCEAFKFGVVFVFLSSNNDNLSNTADFLYDIGFVNE
jgi:hypothetical protein